ncbi:MAG: hypothetical protein ACYC6R_14415 [Anaerolineales bacterium]
MLRTIFLSVLATALLVSGCASSPKTITSTLSVLDGEWTVKMTQSGGILGVRRSVEVYSDGSYMITDDRSNQTLTGELSEDELAKLKEIVANSEYATLEKPWIGGCADCFVYDLEIQGSSRFILQLDDVSLPDSGLETLVLFLHELIDSALQ